MTFVYRTVLILSLLLLALAMLGLHQYGDRMVVAIADHYLESAELELRRRDLHIDLPKGTFSAGELELYDRADNRLLLKVEGLHGRLKWLDLLRADIDSAILAVSKVAVFTGPTEESTAFSPGWLAYRNWLPGQVDIDELAVLWPAQLETPPLVLQKINGRVGQQPGSYKVSVNAQYAGDYLSASGSLQELERLDGGLDSLGVVLNLTSQQREFQVSFDGKVSEASDGLHYQGTASADLKDVPWLLHELEADYPIEGALTVRSELLGDLDGLQLSELHLVLDNSPEFNFSGSGEFDYAFDGTNHLDIVVNTELADLQRLGDIWEIDLGDMGSAQASLRLQGPFDELGLTDISLQTGSDTGIEIDVVGEIRISHFSAERLLADQGVTINVKAPGLDHLRRWTGDLGFETGPWQARATLSQVEDRLRISDIQVSTDDGAGLTLGAQGAIADAGNINTGDFSVINGIKLEVEVNSAESGRLTQLFAPQLPELGSVSARAGIRGNSSLLAVHGLEATIISAGKYRVSADNGSLELHLDAGPLLRELHLGLAADLYDSTGSEAGQRVQRSLGSLKGDLSIAGIEPLQGLALNLQFKELSTSGLLKLTRSEFAYPGETGFLNGKLRLVGSDKGFRLENIDIRNTGNPQITFAVAGAINNLEDLSAIDLRAQGAVADRALLRELSGLALGPWRGKLHITGSETDIHLLSQNRFGDTDLTASLRLGLDASGLTGLAGKLSSPFVNLRDLGLSGDSTPARSGVAPVAAAPDKSGNSQATARTLRDLPRIPIDLQFKLGQIVIDKFKGEQLQAEFVAAKGLYTLRRLELNHGGGHTLLQGSLDTRGELASWTLKGSVLDLPAQELMIDLGVSSDITGSFNTAVDLAADGYSLEALISSLRGSTMLVLEDTTIKGAAYDVLATETVAWFYSGAALEDKTVFSCIMADFTLDQGRARTEELFIATDRMLAVGTAGFDFNQMTVDVEITPRSRGRAIQIPGKVKVAGPIDDLHISSPALTAAGDATAEAVTVIPRVAIKVLDKTVGFFSGGKKEQKEKVLTRCQQVAEP